MRGGDLVFTLALIPIKIKLINLFGVCCQYIFKILKIFLFSYFLLFQNVYME